jgi:hypothetical protein
MNSEFRKAWKEAVIGYFKTLTKQFPGGTEENHDKLQSRYPAIWPTI